MARIHDHRAGCRGGRCVAAGLIYPNADGVSGVTRDASALSGSGSMSDHLPTRPALDVFVSLGDTPRPPAEGGIPLHTLFLMNPLTEQNDVLP